MSRVAVFVGDDFEFPPGESANEDGVLGLGGDVTPASIRRAYRRGIFPWPVGRDYPILWFCPGERCVFRVDQVSPSRRLKQLIKQQHFDIRFDTAFPEVMLGCAEPRDDDGGTWIDDRMFPAYTQLFNQPMQDNVRAHSIEAWRNGELVGGVYGLAIGRVFTGESMFFREANASKVAFMALAERMKERGFVLLDGQVWSDHLGSLGAEMIDRSEFLELLFAVRDDECPLT